MNKNKFLTELNKKLQYLSNEEREEIISFYEERFEKGTLCEGKSEEEVIKDLESPDVIAHNVYTEYGINTEVFKEDKESIAEKGKKKNVLLIILIVFADLAILLPIVSSLLSVVFGIGVASLATLISGFAALFPTNIYSILGKISIMIGLIGISILLFIATLMLLKLFVKTMEILINLNYNIFTGKRGRNFRIKSESKKTRRVVLKGAILGMLLLLVGLILAGINFRDFKENYTLEHTGEDVYEETINLELDWDLNVEALDAKVNFMYVESDEMSIDYSYYKKDEFIFNVDNDNKIITIDKAVNWEDWFRYSYHYVEPDEITIKLPKDMKYKSIEMNLSNSDFTHDFQNSTYLEKIDIYTSNGNLEISNANAGEIRLRSSNGKIVVNSTSSQKIELKTSNGKVIMNDILVNNIYARTSNGGISLNNVKATNNVISDYNIKTSNGKIDLENVYAFRLTIKTSNGDINFNNDDSTYIIDYLCLTASNGKKLGNMIYKRTSC